jgi:hypothetical protein
LYLPFPRATLGSRFVVREGRRASVTGFDAKKVSPIDWGVIGGGALAVLSLFLSWWGVRSRGDGLPDINRTGWQVGGGAWFGAALVAAAGAVVLMRYLGRTTPALPVGEYTLVAALAGLGALLIVWRVFSFKSGSIIGIEYGPRIGAWIGLLAALAAAGAAVKRLLDSGEKPAWDSARMPGGAAAAPPPAPGSWAPPEPVSTDYPPPPPPPAVTYPPPPSPPPVANDDLSFGGPPVAPDPGHDHAHDHDHDMNGHDHPH